MAERIALLAGAADTEPLLGAGAEATGAGLDVPATPCCAVSELMSLRAL